MQILVVFFLVALAGYSTALFHNGEASECFDEAHICMARFAILPGQRDERGQRCKKAVNAIECMEKVVESCTGDRSEDDVKSNLEHLKTYKKETCSIRGVLSENKGIQECFEENGDYISDCLHETVDEVLEKIADLHDVEYLENRKICGLYVETSFCVMRRLEEKCGTEAVREFARKLGNVPNRVKDACGTINVVVDWSPEEDERKK